MNNETQILSEVEALKGQFNDTRVLYREVCALLFFRHGITPTANKLYQYVRKGTMSTPAEALAKFWDDLRSKARVEIDHPDLPDEIKVVAAEAIANIWRQATAGARDELATIRVELQADRERLIQETARAEQEAAHALASAEQLRADVDAAHEMAAQVRAELEAERRAHTGTVGRLQELHSQLEQARVQQQRLQDGFSADLAKAREAIDAADERASAVEKRALLAVERERQARNKADKLADDWRKQAGQVEARARQAALEHAEAIARLQAHVDAGAANEKTLQQAKHDLEQEQRSLREQLSASQQEATRALAEAQTLQGVLDRLAVVAGGVPKAPKRKAAG